MTLHSHGQYPQTQQTMTEKSSAQLAYIKQLISSAEDEEQATKLLANLASLSLGVHPGQSGAGLSRSCHRDPSATPDHHPG